MSFGAPSLPSLETSWCARNSELRHIDTTLARRARTDVEGGPLDPATLLVALARASAPVRRVLARLAGRMEALRGWERIGCARRRDYATERLGISGRQLQELARMDRALEGLPALERAFVSGRVSWTKARLLARVATAEDAEAWIARAVTITAGELSREVRALDTRAPGLLAPETDEDGEGEDEEKETVFVHCTPAVKAKWHRARFWASRIEGHPVPAWAVAERLAAEALSAVPMDAAVLERADVRARPRPEPTNGCAGQCLPKTPVSSLPKREAATTPTAPDGSAPEVQWLASLLCGLEEADPFEVDARLRRALAAEQRLTARMGPLLLRLARGRLFRRYGCPNLGAFAREWLGMSPSKADSLVRLERACEIAPPLREAYRAGRLSWAQALMLVPLLRREDAASWQGAWVAHARRVSVRRLGDEVSQALVLERLEPPQLDPPSGRWADGSDEAGACGGDDVSEERYGASQTRAHASEFPKRMAFFFTAPRDVASLFRGALATVQRRIERRSGRTSSETEALDAILEHAFETWGVGNTTARTAGPMSSRTERRSASGTISAASMRRSSAVAAGRRGVSASRWGFVPAARRLRAIARGTCGYRDAASTRGGTPA